MPVPEPLATSVGLVAHAGSTSPTAIVVTAAKAANPYKANRLKRLMRTRLPHMACSRHLRNSIPTPSMPHGGRRGLPGPFG